MVNFGKIIYSNKSIMKYKDITMFVIFLLFLINTVLVTSPLFIARAQIESGALVERFDGLSGAFEEIYDLELNCSIQENMVCDLPESANGYEIVLTGEPETDKYIWFAEELVIKDEFNISGTYEFLNGITLNPDNYEENTEAILFAMSASTVGRDYYFMYVGQFVQNLIYVLAVSALLSVANYRQAKKKITYSQSIKVTVMTMVGPALIASLIGIFFVQFSTLIFMTIYSLRMMNIYFNVLKSN